MPSIRFILTIIYDSSIEKIDYIYGSNTGTCPISGESIYISYEPGNDLYLDVALKNGYSIDTVTLGTVAGNRITIAAENISVNATLDCTITTKQSTPTLTFKHFFDAGTIGSGTVKFRHYSQKEPSTGETWVINEEPHYSPLSSSLDEQISFESNGETFSRISLSSELVPMHNDAVSIYYGYGDNVYYSGSWQNTAYRTITFAEPVTDSTLLAWFQANGVKQ